MISPLAAAIHRQHPHLEPETVNVIVKATIREVWALGVERSIYLKERGGCGDLYRAGAVRTFASLVFQAGSCCTD